MMMMIHVQPLINTRKGH